MKMDTLLKKIGGRKFILVLLVFIVTAVFMWFGFLTKEDFTDLTKMLLVAYPASAIGQTILVKDDTETNDTTEWMDVRKFGFTILVFVVVCALLYMKKIVGASFVDMNQWLVGVYLTGNVMTKVADKGLNITVTKAA